MSTLPLPAARRPPAWRAALRRASFAALLAGAMMDATAAAPIVVDDGSDSAICVGTSYTLRCAIIYANAHPFTNIRFAPGFPAVLLDGSLPTITGNGTWIDGSDSVGNYVGPRIDGAFWSGPTGDAITINANDVTISNIKIVRIPSTLVDNADIHIVGGKDNTIADDYLGILPGATQCAGNDAAAGVSITGDRSGAAGDYNGVAYIYGSTIGCHNLAGVYAMNSNYVTLGTNSGGTASGNLIGIAADGIHAAGNGTGVYADLQSDHMTIRNNRIGYSSLYGVYSHTAASTSIAFNEIANNAGLAVVFLYGDTHSVIGNKIGTTSDGLGSAPNGAAGIAFNFVGTGNVVSDNVVAHNGGPGILVSDQSHVLIENNDIYANSGLPIDLGNDGFSPNGLHLPPGPNDWLPYPVITDSTANLITGTKCVNCGVYIFTAIGDPSRPGGGAKFLQNIPPDGNGIWVTLLPAGMTRDDVTLMAAGGGDYDSSEMSPRDSIFRNGFE
jgi:parallel beta-helix repeat protein